MINNLYLKCIPWTLLVEQNQWRQIWRRRIRVVNIGEVYRFYLAFSLHQCFHFMNTKQYNSYLSCFHTSFRWYIHRSFHYCISFYDELLPFFECLRLDPQYLLVSYIFREIYSQTLRFLDELPLHILLSLESLYLCFHTKFFWMGSKTFIIFY